MRLRRKKYVFLLSPHMPYGHVRPHTLARKYQAGASYRTKPILRKKRKFGSLRSNERLLYLQANKSLSKLNAETRVLTYWSWSVLCCGTVCGRPFSTSVQPPRTCLETRRLSLNENLRARQGGKDTKRLSSFSFLWLACVANVSARVNARKLETEQKKKKFCFLSLPLQVFAQ